MSDISLSRVELGQIRARICARLSDYFPQADASLTQLELEIVKRRDYSHVYLFNVLKKDGSALPGSLAVKVFSRDSAGSDAARQQYAAFAQAWPAFENSATLTIPRPLDFYPELSAVVTDRVQGTPLQQLLKAHFLLPGRQTKLIELNHGAGSWLRQFHAATASTAGRLDVNAKADQWHEQLRRLEAFGLTAQLCQRLRAVVAVLIRDLSGAEMTMASVHGDFTIDNVVSDGERIIVLDLGGRDLNAMDHDIATYLNSLALAGLSWPVPRSLIEKCGGGFLSGYFAGADYSRDAVSFLRLVGLTSVALEILGRRSKRRFVRWRVLQYVDHIFNELIDGRWSDKPRGRKSIYDRPKCER